VRNESLTKILTSANKDNKTIKEIYVPYTYTSVRLILINKTSENHKKQVLKTVEIIEEYNTQQLKSNENGNGNGKIFRTKKY
jgi:predicted GTPase|tara:strand:+ start:49 stop:294 length:246 start_codon:yes stop_codon:yes gene_type:complete